MHEIADERKSGKSGEGGKKLRQTVDWHDVYAVQCEACREIYGDKNEEPPCDTCRPEFMEENSKAVEIFYIVRKQLIMGPEGPIDIKHGPIHSMMELHNVKDKKECFEKVLTMANKWFKGMK